MLKVRSRFGVCISVFINFLLSRRRLTICYLLHLLSFLHLIFNGRFIIHVIYFLMSKRMLSTYCRVTCICIFMYSRICCSIILFLGVAFE